jgi:hypothetical protein
MHRGERIIASTKQALAFAKGESNTGTVHIPDGFGPGLLR